MWARIKSRADDAASYGISFKKNADNIRLEQLDRGQYTAIELDSTAAIYADIITALESGNATVVEILDILEDKLDAMRDYAVNQDPSRGQDLWNQVQSLGLPDSLGHYHATKARKR